MFHILEWKNDNITQVECHSDHDPVQEIPGPILADNCNGICDKCCASVRKGDVPQFALCNGLWLGDVPEELKDLSFAEQLIIFRVQHFNCFI